MAEELTLTTPVVEPEKVTSKYRVVALTLNSELVMSIPAAIGSPPAPPVNAPGFVQVQLRDNLGVGSSYTYAGDAALEFIKFVNTGNFTTKSLNRRILEKLNNEGKLVGTVSGAPDLPSTPAE